MTVPKSGLSPVKISRNNTAYIMCLFSCNTPYVTSHGFLYMTVPKSGLSPVKFSPGLHADASALAASS